MVFSSPDTGLEDRGLIILSNVLEHILDVESFLSIISRRVNKGTYLFVQVPARHRFCEMTTEYMGEFSIEHINYFGMKSLDNLMKKHGFRLKFDSDRVVIARKPAWVLEQC